MIKHAYMIVESGTNKFMPQEDVRNRQAKTRVEFTTIGLPRLFPTKNGAVNSARLWKMGPITTKISSMDPRDWNKRLYSNSRANIELEIREVQITYEEYINVKAFD